MSAALETTASAAVGALPTVPVAAPRRRRALPRGTERPLWRRESRRNLRLVWVRLAQAMLLVLSLGGAGLLAVQIATWPDHPLADITHFAFWTRLIEQLGVVGAYSGRYPATYMIYPPGMAYAYACAAWLAAHLTPIPALFGAAGFDDAQWLHICIKLVSIGGHVALAGVLCAMVAAVGGFWRGWIAATLYAWNPAALIDIAYWGQGDSLNIALLAAATGVLFLPVLSVQARRTRRRAVRGWQLWRRRVLRLAILMLLGGLAGMLLGASSMTKPQTWIFLPLLGWVAFRRVGPAGLLALGAAGTATCAAMVQPWVRAGRVDELMSVFTNVAQVMPSVSANGHNLWWLKLPGIAVSVFDTASVGGFGTWWQLPPLLDFATLGRLGFGLCALVPLLRLTGRVSLRLVLASLAFTSVAYFMTITQVHENHMYAAVPFLAATAALDAWFVVPFVMASVTVFLNMGLHDFLIGDALTATLAAWLPWKDALSLQTANAVLNVAGFVLLALLFLRRPVTGRQTPLELRRRARLVLALGSVVAGGALAALAAILRSEDLQLGLWQRLADRALRAGPIEAHLGHHTPDPVLLARAALDYANLLYTLGAVAAITGSLALLAALWWLLCARFASRMRTAAATLSHS